MSSRIVFLIAPFVPRSRCVQEFHWLCHSGRRWKSGICSRIISRTTSVHCRTDAFEKSGSSPVFAAQAGSFPRLQGPCQRSAPVIVFRERTRCKHLVVLTHLTAFFAHRRPG